MTTHPDGRTELEWDWDALCRDVQQAIASVSQPKRDLISETEAKVKKTRAKKTVAKKK